MTTLKQAREQGKLNEFIAERESAGHGDRAAFDKTVAAMAGKSKAARPASKKGCADD